MRNSIGIAAAIGIEVIRSITGAQGMRFCIVITGAVGVEVGGSITAAKSIAVAIAIKFNTIGSVAGTEM